MRQGGAALLKSIQSDLSMRTYELATLAAARALRSSSCSLAHGSVLANNVFDAPTVTAIMKEAHDVPLESRERALMASVERVVLNADRIRPADVERLRAHGDRDEEIFDVRQPVDGCRRRR